MNNKLMTLAALATLTFNPFTAMADSSEPTPPPGTCETDWDACGFRDIDATQISNTNLSKGPVIEIGIDEVFDRNGYLLPPDELEEVFIDLDPARLAKEGQVVIFRLDSTGLFADTDQEGDALQELTWWFHVPEAREVKADDKGNPEIPRLRHGHSTKEPIADTLVVYVGELKDGLAARGYVDKRYEANKKRAQAAQATADEANTRSKENAKLVKASAYANGIYTATGSLGTIEVEGQFRLVGPLRILGYGGMGYGTTALEGAAPERGLATNYGAGAEVLLWDDGLNNRLYFLMKGGQAQVRHPQFGGAAYDLRYLTGGIRYEYYNLGKKVNFAGTLGGGAAAATHHSAGDLPSTQGMGFLNLAITRNTP